MSPGVRLLGLCPPGPRQQVIIALDTVSLGAHPALTRPQLVPDAIKDLVTIIIITGCYLPATRGRHVLQSAAWQSPGIEAGEAGLVTTGQQGHGVAGLQGPGRRVHRVCREKDENNWGVFQAPTEAQGTPICICPSARSVQTCLERSIFIFLG